MKMITKKLLTLSLVLSLLLTGAFAIGTTYVANANEGLLMVHDGPSNNRGTI